MVLKIKKNIFLNITAEKLVYFLLEAPIRGLTGPNWKAFKKRICLKSRRAKIKSFYNIYDSENYVQNKELFKKTIKHRILD